MHQGAVFDARIGGKEIGPETFPKTFSWAWVKKLAKKMFVQLGFSSYVQTYG